MMRYGKLAAQPGRQEPTSACNAKYYCL